MNRLPLWPSLITSVMLIILLGVGAWQVERLYWKRELIAKAGAQQALAPVPLPVKGVIPDAWQFRRATVSGVFRHDLEIHLYANSARGEPGYMIITPLQRPGGGHVLISRGWAPMALRRPETRQAGQITGPVEITGTVRKAWPRHAFVAENEPQANIWFYGDLAGMAEFRGLGYTAPVFLEADATPNQGGWPLGGQSRVTFRNDHLQYAFTWFSLALALAAVYGSYVFGRKRDGD